MFTRRGWLKATAGASVGMSILPAACRMTDGDASPLTGAEPTSPQGVLMRAIPSTGEEIPVVGLGSSASFQRMAAGDDDSGVRAVLQSLFDGGGTVFDTAPSYGPSEAIAGQLVQDMGTAEQVFWATKLNVVPRGQQSADPAAARAQLERSFERLGQPVIDLIQVHNLADPPTQLGLLRELKAEGRVRYIGITSTRRSRYPILADVMRNEPLDFIGIDYAVDSRAVEETILPLAAERGIGVLVYLPFGRRRLWSRVDGVDLPSWAADFDAQTWAQFFIKFTLAHPTVTCVTPATSSAEHMTDNVAGGMGRLPDPDQVARMIEVVNALPEA